MSDLGDLPEPPVRRRIARSAGDVRRLIEGVVVLVVSVVVAVIARGTVGGLESDLAELLGRLPDDLVALIVGLAELLSVIAPLVIGVALLVQRRFAVVGLFVGVNIIAAVAADALLSLLADPTGAGVSGSDLVTGWLTDSRFPATATVASAAAVATVAARWLERRWNRPVTGVVVVLVVLRLLASTEPAFDVVISLAVGSVVGSLALLVVGGPDRRPGWEQIGTTLRAVGIDARGPLGYQPLGVSSSLRWVETLDGPVAVIVRSPEDSDVEFLERAGRSVRLRSEHVAPRLGSPRRRLEHEVLLLTLAERSGVRVPSVRQVLRVEADSMLAVVDVPPGRPLAAVPPELVDDAVLADAWSQVAALRAAGIAHRRIDTETVLVQRRSDASSWVWLVDFDEAEVAAGSIDLARDVVSLIVATALVVGPRRAVAAAVARIGTDAVATAIPLLQPLALTPVTRRAAAERPELLGELRHAIEAWTGGPITQPVELRRVRPRTVVAIVVATLAFYVLLPQLATVEEAAGVLADAEAAWLVPMLLAAVSTYLFAALALVAAAGPPVRWWPAVRSQLASKFVSVFTPGPTGDLVVKVRFLQRSGLTTGAASAASGLSAAAGFVAHVVLLFLATVWVGRSGRGGFALPDGYLIGVIAGVVVVAGLLVLATPFGRRRLLTPALAFVRTGFGQIATLARRPARLSTLFAGSAGTTLANGFVLVAAVAALGGGLTVPQILAVYLAGAALATAAPTPGGLGAIEAALVAGLAGFGLDQGRAVAAVLAFRLITFWLPVLPGWITFTWMQRREEL